MSEESRVWKMQGPWEIDMPMGEIWKETFYLWRRAAKCHLVTVRWANWATSWSLTFWIGPKTVSDLREPVYSKLSIPTECKHICIQTGLITQVWTCCLSWAAAPEFQWVYYLLRCHKKCRCLMKSLF